MGKLLELLLGWSFHVSMLVSAVIVLVYIFLGGLTSRDLQRGAAVLPDRAGFLPLVLLGLQDVGGWDGPDGAARAGGDRRAASRPARGPHAWRHMGTPATNPMGVEWFGLVMGLGFVLSFGYWCTDFLVVQRAMAADSMTAARRTPLIAAFPKMFFPFLVILPGHDRDRAARGTAAGMIPAKLARRCAAARRAGRRCSTTTSRCR